MKVENPDNTFRARVKVERRGIVKKKLSKVKEYKSTREKKRFITEVKSEIISEIIAISDWISFQETSELSIPS